MQNSFVRAFENNELSLYYQPRIDLQSGTIIGVEALLRWNHPERGMVFPEKLIPLAEQLGFIIPLGEWVLKKACQQTKQWHLNGMQLVVSVQLSSEQLTSNNTVDTIKRIIEETNLAPQFLELEITENVVTKANNRLPIVLQELKGLGVKICLHDFGTESAFLEWLEQLQIESIKINPSLFREGRKNNYKHAIIKTVISKAQKFHLNVIADGIETMEQLLFLQQNHCQIGQGSFFSKPMSAHYLENRFLSLQQTIKQFAISKEDYNQIWLKNPQTSEPTMKSNKLEVVRELAAGVAHEIRNPLTSMKGFIQLLEYGAENKEYFDYIYSDFFQIEQYIDDLLMVANPTINIQTNINLEQLIINTIKENINHEKYQKINLVYQFDSEIPPIDCDSQLVGRVIRHLVSNSMEAIGNEGVISIQVTKEEHQILLTITDNGVGIDKDRLEKLGEPYFSLKEKGTGLGLMMCYQIVRQHKGSISIESKEEKGTIVRVRLPLAAEQ